MKEQSKKNLFQIKNNCEVKSNNDENFFKIELNYNVNQ